MRNDCVVLVFSRRFILFNILFAALSGLGVLARGFACEAGLVLFSRGGAENAELARRNIILYFYGVSIYSLSGS